MPITILDLVLLAVMLISGLLAMVRGFMREILSIAAWGAAALVTLYAFGKLLPTAKSYFNNDTVAAVVVVAGVFIGTLIVVSVITVRDVIARLMDAGLDSIPGGGAEVLDDEIRTRISRLKCTSEDWEVVHRTAHSLGMRTTATMMFGCGEDFHHRVNHFERVRRLQEETGGFTAFIPWIFAPDNTPLGKKVPEATAADYLKTLAISRLYLDNIDHIQSSWLTPGIKICQVGLQFGADDV